MLRTVASDLDLIFVSDEKAVKPDIKMMDSIIEVGLVPWFDADEIAKAVRKDKKSSKKSSKKSN